MTGAGLAGHGLGGLVERDGVFLAEHLEDGLALFFDALSAKLDQGGSSSKLSNIQDLA